MKNMLKLVIWMQKKENGYNAKGSSVNSLLTNIEKIILTTMINYSTDKKIVKKMLF